MHHPPYAAALSALAVAVALLIAPTATAARHLVYGVNDASVLNWDVSGQAVHDLGVQEVAVPIRWSPQSVVNHHELGTIPASQPVLVVLYGSRDDSPDSPSAREQFCEYANGLTWAHPNIKQIQVWNEPEPGLTFWKYRTRDYLDLLARCYDGLHRRVRVLGPGGHPNLGLQLAFVRAVRGYYRVTHRRRALFDGYSVHPYWQWSDDGLVARRMNRLWRGLPQRSPKRGLRFWWTETGMESSGGPPPNGYAPALYHGTDTRWRLSGTADQQAARVAALAYRARRDPLVAADFNFLLWDEPDLARWQSGLLYADGSRKPAFDAFRGAIAR